MGVLKKGNANIVNNMLIKNNLQGAQPDITIIENEHSVQSRHPQIQQQNYTSYIPVQSQYVQHLPVSNEPVNQFHRYPPGGSTSEQKPAAIIQKKPVPATSTSEQKPAVVVQKKSEPVSAKPNIDTEANTKAFNSFLSEQSGLNAKFKNADVSTSDGNRLDVIEGVSGFFYIVGESGANKTIDIYPTKKAFSKIGKTYITSIFDIVDNAGQNKVIKPARAFITNFGYYQIHHKGLVECK